MAIHRRADVSWTGDLLAGSGVIESVTSGSLASLPVSWASRAGMPEGRTSPEELIAAAHASCFAMALAAGLAQAGTPPQRLKVAAEVAFDRVNGSWRIVSSTLSVHGTVPGIDAAGFQRAAESAKDGCPVSQALKGNVQLSVNATLES